MATDQFRSILHQQPFRRFTIRMADGRAFAVANPDFIAMSPSGGTVVVYESDENFSVLDPLLMSELQVSSANGQSG